MMIYWKILKSKNPNLPEEIQVSIKACQERVVIIIVVVKRKIN